MKLVEVNKYALNKAERTQFYYKSIWKYQICFHANISLKINVTDSQHTKGTIDKRWCGNKFISGAAHLKQNIECSS